MKVVDLLILKGADIGASNEYGYTPLHIAVEDHAEFVELLISKGLMSMHMHLTAPVMSQQLALVQTG